MTSYEWAGVLDLSDRPVLPIPFALLFDPCQEQVDELLAKHEYLMIFTFVTAPACSAPDMTWVDGYMRVVRPLWLGNFKESDRDAIAEQYARFSLKSENIVKLAV